MKFPISVTPRALHVNSHTNSIILSVVILPSDSRDWTRSRLKCFIKWNVKKTSRYSGLYTEACITHPSCPPTLPFGPIWSLWWSGVNFHTKNVKTIRESPISARIISYSITSRWRLAVDKSSKNFHVFLMVYKKGFYYKARYQFQ